MGIPDQGLAVKDASGVTKELAVELLEGSGYLVPYHYVLGDVLVTSSISNPVAVTGTVFATGFPEVQQVTASLLNSLGVTGTVAVDNFPTTQTVTASVENPVPYIGAYGISVNSLSVTTVDWDGTSSGSFRVADRDYARKELIIHNSGPGFLYIKLSPDEEDANNRHGFTNSLVKDQVPLNYNFVVYPSGTYTTSDASRVLYHGGFFVSSSTPLTGTVQSTSIS